MSTASVDLSICQERLEVNTSIAQKILPPKIKGKNICISQGWMGLFFMEQKENLLQISPVPHRSKFFNFLFQIVKWGNFAETLVYNTLCFTFASPEI